MRLLLAAAWAAFRSATSLAARHRFRDVSRGFLEAAPAGTTPKFLSVLGRHHAFVHTQQRKMATLVTTPQATGLTSEHETGSFTSIKLVS